MDVILDRIAQLQDWLLNWITVDGATVAFFAAIIFGLLVGAWITNGADRG